MRVYSQPSSLLSTSGRILYTTTSPSGPRSSYTLNPHKRRMTALKNSVAIGHCRS